MAGHKLPRATSQQIARLQEAAQLRDETGVRFDATGGNMKVVPHRLDGTLDLFEFLLDLVVADRARR